MSIDLIETRSGHGKVLAALHERCFEQAWSAEEFERLLALPNSAGVICSPIGRRGLLTRWIFIVSVRRRKL